MTLADVLTWLERWRPARPAGGARATGGEPLAAQLAAAQTTALVAVRWAAAAGTVRWPA